MFNVRFKPSRLLATAVMGLLVVWLSGCAAPQPAPSSPEIVVSAVSPDEVRQTESTGAVVRWGGTIASINNVADGKSVVEIVSRPLRGGGRPVHNNRSAGRFIAETTDFLDPEIVKVGRDLTVLGSVNSVRDGKIGEANYRFPVVTVDSYRYWKPQVALPPRQHYHWYGPHSHDPFWDDWPFPPHRRHRSGASGSLSIILR